MRSSLALIFILGCSTPTAATPPVADSATVDAAPVARIQSFKTNIRANGVSDPVEFVVPPNARSITVVATGAVDKLYALAALQLSDGVDRVNIDPSASYGAAMRDAYVKEQTAAMPGELYQTIRLGTFTHVYPYAPGQSALAGAASLRVVSDATEGEVNLRIYMPEDDGANALHLNAVAISDSVEMSKSPAFLAEAQKIFDQANIRLVIDDAVTIKGNPLSSMLDVNEPQEPPDGGAGAIAKLGQAKVASAGLNVFVIDRLASGILGLSLGTPGPPERDSYYFGVILRNATDAQLARTFAHEVCHFMALQHVVNKSVSGKVHPDPLDDTEPGSGNLMENGTKLTPAQSFALSRSALLVR